MSDHEDAPVKYEFEGRMFLITGSGPRVSVTLGDRHGSVFPTGRGGYDYRHRGMHVGGRGSLAQVVDQLCEDLIRDEALAAAHEDRKRHIEERERDQADEFWTNLRGETRP